MGVYAPTLLIVVLSWLSFWINPDASAARVPLGTDYLINSNSIFDLPLVFTYTHDLSIFLVLFNQGRVHGWTLDQKEGWVRVRMLLS